MILGMCIGASNARFNPDLSWKYTLDYFKYWLFFVLLVQMIDSQWKMEWFHRTLILSAAWLVYRCWDLRGTTGPRFENYGGGSVEDANHFAAALVFLLPFAFQKIFHKDRRIGWCATILCFGIIMSIIISGSRGGFLGLAAMSLILFYIYKEHRLKFILMGTTLVILGLSFMNPYQRERITTIFKYQQGEQMDASSQKRLEFWALSWTIFTENPLYGVGLGNFPYYSGIRILGYPPGKPGFVAHSLWFEVLAEGGLVVSVPFLLMIFCFFRRCRRLIKYHLIYDRENKLYIYTLIAAMASFFASATFINRIIYEPMYWAVALAIAHEYILKNTVAQQQIIKK